MTFVLRFQGTEKVIRDMQAEETTCAKALRWEGAKCIWGAERGAPVAGP